MRGARSGDNREVHRHEVDPKYMTVGKKYLQTPQSEGILLPLARNKMSLTVIMGELSKAYQGFQHEEIYPTLTRINSKMKYIYQKQAMEEIFENIYFYFLSSLVIIG